VNWLIDAQLPPQLAALFRERGHDAIHTLDLPLGNRTTDEVIIAYADQRARIVVTKDADFVPHCVFRRKPQPSWPKPWCGSKPSSQSTTSWNSRPLR
jgi:predicted nuclease of predicted toxin-antitoxin system